MLPELTRKKTTFPWETVMSDGSNLNSVIVTLVEPAGWVTLLPPHPASNAMATSMPASALVIFLL